MRSSARSPRGLGVRVAERLRLLEPAHELVPGGLELRLANRRAVDGWAVVTRRLAESAHNTTSAPERAV